MIGILMGACIFGMVLVVGFFFRYVDLYGCRRS